MRQTVNKMLADARTGKEVCEWVNRQKEAKKLWAEKFEGEELTESNVTSWREGGFQDWARARERANAVKAIECEAAEVGWHVADNLAFAVAAHLALEVQRMEEEKAGPTEKLKMLERVARVVEILRMGNDRLMKTAWLEEKFHPRIGEPGEGGIPPEVMERIEKELRLL